MAEWRPHGFERAPCAEWRVSYSLSSSRWSWASSPGRCRPEGRKDGSRHPKQLSLSGPCFSSPTGLWCGSDCLARCELEAQYRADAIRVLDAYMSFEATLSLVNRRVQGTIGDIQGHPKLAVVGALEPGEKIARGRIVMDVCASGWYRRDHLTRCPAASAGGKCIRRRSDTGGRGKGIFLTTFFARQ